MTIPQQIKEAIFFDLCEVAREIEELNDKSNSDFYEDIIPMKKDKISDTLLEGYDKDGKSLWVLNKEFYSEYPHFLAGIETDKLPNYSKMIATINYNFKNGEGDQCQDSFMICNECLSPMLTYRAEIEQGIDDRTCTYVVCMKCFIKKEKLNIIRTEIDSLIKTLGFYQTLVKENRYNAL